MVHYPGEAVTSHKPVLLREVAQLVATNAGLRIEPCVAEDLGKRHASTQHRNIPAITWRAVSTLGAEWVSDQPKLILHE
jgi:hypothetical protein